ncbi:DUF2167 domain-containing protein [Rhodanobacter sp. AS-Z3]|uniref:DUF2167 domain-containing protein n=1 Tax=Rhodanobacter sp. AS-Z3 TaxID=3031330 RepID=UPI0024793D73|nr:DUF2167 domain-containing protein [Rhodanobacter sp. AS-Z3]WEN15062.1 DUF2167 domain-containing protein [Rhodanobacter sp. AS-Z3]
MKRLFSVLVALALACVSVTALAQDDDADGLPWQKGPVTVQLGDQATLNVPEGYAFLDAAGTVKFNEVAHNPPGDGDEYTMAGKGWVAFFSYGDVGYIKDDETIDADAILANIREGTAAANKERRARGWGEMSILGWSARPEYDTQLKSLTWSILGEDQSTHEKVVNYNARLLGRHGVMSVVMVTDPATLATSIMDFKRRVKGFEYVSGESYAEYQPGDHVAAYGLAALITGGAAAVAAKKGLFSVIGGFLVAAWKFVLAGLVAASAWFKSLFKRK